VDSESITNRKDSFSESATESNFRTHQFSEQFLWRENLLNDIDIETINYYKLDNKFYKKFSEGRAYFFSPYAERINLLCDLTMLVALFEKLNIQFLIFQSPLAEKLESEYLKDFFKEDINKDTRFFDFENFSFCQWAEDQKFQTIDDEFKPGISHYGPDAHEAFANKVLIPKLHETGQI